MNPALSLDASAEAFLTCGQESAAFLCRQMAKDCRNMGEIGHALYRHWATEMAEKAAQRLEEHNRRAA